MIRNRSAVDLQLLETNRESVAKTRDGARGGRPSLLPQSCLDTPESGVRIARTFTSFLRKISIRRVAQTPVRRYWLCRTN